MCFNEELSTEGRQRRAPDPGRNGERDFHGEQRTNETHASATDPEAKLFCKGGGKEAKLSFIGHALMENRHGLLVDSRVIEANGTAERDVAETMLAAVPGRTRSPSAATRASTPGASSPPCAISRSRHMSPRTRPTGARRSTAAPPSIKATP